ncbi:hypothetical protein LJK87_25825 [Paenibacillus sp. P25]|nr:hypothetical protein LJK87_25825 [Paenibacillus sp. P25]
MVSTTVNGAPQTVSADGTTNPGHQIYRLPNGTRWEHKGENSAIYQFIPTSSSTNGVSDYPGIIPEFGYIRNPGDVIASTGQTSYDTGPETNGRDLRYTHKNPPYGMEDKANDPSMDGAAATRAYDVTPPDAFFLGTSGNDGE